MAPTDHELMAGTASGDREAFSQLYDRLAPRVYGLVLHVLRNQTDAEDVLQETFFQVWRSADKYDPARCPLDGWVLMMARCRALDRLRRRKDAPPAPDDLPADTDHPARDLERAEDATRVTAALACLPAEQRDAIRLAFYGGYTHDQISRRLGLTLGTVKTRIRLGMIRLRTCLAEKTETHRP
jgi:RNA polymerase sigma-70 factor (ECF subfamily)